MLPDPERIIRVDGPWVHRDVSANSCRFHLAESGDGPLVVLLHGFPEMWWAWRAQIPAIANAGYRVIAIDLRGYAGSDHPPHGYDPITMAEDVAGVIRSLGELDATIIGHGWGALAAWTTAVYQPDVVRSIGVVSTPHPRILRRSILRRASQFRRTSYAIPFQVPFAPESSLSRHDGARVHRFLSDWSHDTTWLSDDVSGVYRSAFIQWPTPHCAIEYHRWAVRSMLRPDGLRYAKRMKQVIDIPVLHVHGEHDPAILIESVTGSVDYAGNDYTWRTLSCGHFPHEEAPSEFNEIVLDWLLTHPT